MPRTRNPSKSKSKSKPKPTAKKAAAPSAKTKKRGPPPKPKAVSHTDDGTPIVNATAAQLRRGLRGKAPSGQLVRVPQLAARSRLYAAAAAIVGEREGLALPYHGGRTWRCEVRVSDAAGASGDNRAGKGGGSGGGEGAAAPPAPKPKRRCPTPLFRWYRGDLVLATLPYVLEDVVEVDARMPGKKRWANGMSDDELDSSDEEWDDEKYRVGPSTKMDMEVSALTESAREDSTHPLPQISRTWISPDLQRFQSRKSAVAHAEALVARDLLIDRTLYGYGHNGVRLRPVKPTRKQALEAGMARFLRDGLWVVGQEEMWIEERRDVLVRKQKRRMRQSAGRDDDDEEEDDETLEELEKQKKRNDSTSVEDPSAEVEEMKKPVAVADEGEEEDETLKELEEQKKKDNSTSIEDRSTEVEEMKKPVAVVVAAAAAADEGGDEEWVAKAKAAARAVAGYIHPVLDAPLVARTAADGRARPGLDTGKNSVGDSLDAPLFARVAANGRARPELVRVRVRLDTGQNSVDDSKPAASDKATNDDNDGDAKLVSPVESDASMDAKPDDCSPAPTGSAATKRSPGPKLPPPFTPSTHYRLNRKQINLCYAACVEHYESVMRTVRARSLYHELADGFDCFRERGRGRYDMELDAFDTNAFAFLTDPGKAAWMPIVRKILGEDASLVHKGCFLSLPGSETQVYHQDGVHLNKKVHKPCYAINVFIPLVDCGMSNGPTEFCLGTHYLGHENFVKENIYTPCVNAGTPVIFDYRLGHRGLRNCGQAIRPVVYLTYSSKASGKEFRDSVNFSRKRYHKLGDIAEKPLTREERAQKRRRQEK